ncbi:cell division protein ZipA [Billgrantia ethanolica]|uniref:Cell division protein ZipA n=1 Tax=Billgrantia ethanolica TaxID=2733486 RepID=A0ABS9A806_9GAMM|nr:cell division protein ZipA [Halomonas ethanolica]MCE8003939.1 cell division protein ZipA [Halomonas ethanolica]
MELREWLIILGLALVTLIVIDGVRRLKRQRRVPRLDQAGGNNNHVDSQAEADDDGNWELPNGGARVVRPASYSEVKSKPKLERQEHPGPSRVLAGFKEAPVDLKAGTPNLARPAASATDALRPVASAIQASDSVAADTRSSTTQTADRVPQPEVSAKQAEPKLDLGQAERKRAEEPSVAPASSRTEEAPAAASAAKAPATEPVAAKPLSFEPSVTEPAISEPAVSKPGVSEPVVSEPIVSEPGVTEPKAAESPASEPRASEAVAAKPAVEESEERREPTLSALDDDEPALESAAVSAEAEPLAADPEDHDLHHDEDERYRLVDLEGMGNSIKSGSRRVGESMHRFGVSMQQRLAKRREQKREERARREQERAEKAAREAQQRREAAEAQAAREAELRRLEAEAIDLADDDDPLFAPPRARGERHAEAAYAAPADHEPYAEPVDYAERAEPSLSGASINDDDDVVRAHPTLARALRHNVNAERARETLSHADEIIVISVLSRDEEGFSGEALLNLMLACGLRYSSDMGIFHRFETEDPDSELQFSMVNVLKPGTFPIEAMDEFRTPGITLLMPLPGALDTAAAFEAMVETAMVIVRNLGGELKDENHSVMTAQTVEFARQRVQEFERRNRLNRYQVN